MKRRLGLYLLCGLLLFGLTGCGGAKPETTAEGNSEEIAITDVDTTESSDSETEEPEGANLTIALLKKRKGAFASNL